MAFWDTQARGSRVYDLHVSNDRLAIYVVSVPRVTPVEHLVHVAEVATLAALALLLVLLVHAILNRVNRRGPQPATLLVREVRASFTRKLFLAFVATSVIPVLTLAFVVRTFVASRLRADVEAEATRTAAVARRVIEETLALQQRGGESSATALSDDVMVWISRVINQDVNIFDGPDAAGHQRARSLRVGPAARAHARTRSIARSCSSGCRPSSARTRSGRCSTSWPRRPSASATRDAILTVPHDAAPARDRARDRRARSRRATSARSCSSCSARRSATGWPSRIGDPVAATHARVSRRIAAGDLERSTWSRAPPTSCSGLVEAFNTHGRRARSASASNCERTNRLEAWAEMARQVAHDIKNPLTPIQLSAEHLRRVHQDRGDAAVARARTVRRHDPAAGAAAPPDLVGVRELRLVADGAPGATSHRRTWSDEVLAGYRIGLPSNVRVRVVDRRRTCRRCSIDRALLGRAMINVIENALHAMPSGGVVTRAVPHARDDAVGPRVASADTGVGMDEAALARALRALLLDQGRPARASGCTIARRNVELTGGHASTSSSEKGVGHHGVARRCRSPRRRTRAAASHLARRRCADDRLGGATAGGVVDRLARPQLATRPGRRRPTRR